MLRDGFPEAKIGWAIDTELAPAIEGHPALDYVHRCSRRTWSKMLANPAAWSRVSREFRAFVNEVRAVGYDVSVDAQGLFKTALLPYIAGIKRRIGYRHGREFSSMFYTERYLERDEYFDPAVSHLQHMAELAHSIGAGEVRQIIEPPVLSDSIRQNVSALLEGAFAAKAPIVAIAPATQWVSKQWPVEHWSALLRQLLEETDLNLIVQGSAADAKSRRANSARLRAPRNWRAESATCSASCRFQRCTLCTNGCRWRLARAALRCVAGAMRVPVYRNLWPNRPSPHAADRQPAYQAVLHRR